MTDQDPEPGPDERERIEQDRAERIRRLQERRRSAAPTANPVHEAGRAPTRKAARTAHDARDRPRRRALRLWRRTPDGATGAPGRAAGRRRKHHFNASRIVLAGLSVTSFFSILAAFGLAQPQPAGHDGGRPRDRAGGGGSADRADGNCRVRPRRAVAARTGDDREASTRSHDR